MPSRVLRLWNPDASAWEEVGDSRLGAHLTAPDPHPTYVNVTGDTMTGALTVAQPLVVTGGGVLRLDGAPGAYRYIGLTSGGAHRWTFGIGGTAETGSNAGADFFLNRQADAGNDLGTALSFSRATGAATFGGAVSTPGYVGWLDGANALQWYAAYSGGTWAVNRADGVAHLRISSGAVDVPYALSAGAASVAGKPVAVSPDAANALEWRANGFYVTPKITVAASAPGSPATGDLWIW